MPVDRLSALAAAFPAEASVTIEGKDAIAHVNSGRSRFRLPTLPITELPTALVIGEESGRVELDRADALALLRPAFAMSKEETRFYLCGLLLQDTDAGLASVATDGFRLARSIVAASGLSSDRHLIVPRQAVEVIEKLVSGKRVEAVTVRASRTLLAVESNNFAFTSKRVDGSFPDYTRIIPVPSGNSVTVDRHVLLQSLERAAAVVDANQRRVVGLQWDAADPTVHLCLTDSDAVDDGLAAEVTGSGRVAVSINQLTEMLEAIDGNRAHLDSRSAGDAVLVTDPENRDFLGLQLPHQWAVPAKAA